MQETQGFQFWHSKMDVYRVAIEFVKFVGTLGEDVFECQSGRRQQLCRAADSIPLNIAEGQVQASIRMRKKHYQIALGSAAECDAIVELLQIKGHATGDSRERLARIGAMLWRLIR